MKEPKSLDNMKKKSAPNTPRSILKHQIPSDQKDVHVTGETPTDDTVKNSVFLSEIMAYAKQFEEVFSVQLSKLNSMETFFKEKQQYDIELNKQMTQYSYAVDEDLIEAQDRIMQKLAKKINNLDGETERLTSLRDNVVSIF